MPVRLTDADDRITVKDSDLGLPDSDVEASYELRPITRDDFKRIIKANTKKVPNGRGAMESQTDMTAVNEDLLDHCLVGWSGIAYRGQPAPCDRAMKMRVDPVRAERLMQLAGLNQVDAADEARRESFRSTEGLR